MSKLFSHNPVCTDDFGTSVYWCRYDTGYVWANNCVVIGSTIPNVKARYVIAPTQEAKRRHKLAGIAFHESDVNCNTCAHLKRDRSPKQKDGFMFGQCTNQNADVSEHPYRDRVDHPLVQFHPDDWMGMTCYQSRWQNQNTEDLNV